MDNGLYRLVGRIQNYAWGGDEFIPRLLGLQPEPHTPYAEYWLGAHHRAPSQIILAEDRTVPLDAFIAEHPQQALGQRIALQYGRLPYLLKVLDVDKPLSIQVHPSKSQAEVGFEREDRLGIPLDSPQRNYKDRNHKPELMVALGDFWLLHGFLPEEKLRDVLEAVPEFHVFLRLFENGGYAGLYEQVMTMPPAEVDAILAPLAKRVCLQAGTDGLAESSADYWLARAVRDSGSGPYDRGLFSLYFLNLICLRQGQAIFQDAGTPHAYLRGQNIEVMANSDNVVRGGLTEKHVDVSELLRTVRFKGVCPRVIEGTVVDSPLEDHYSAPTQDFRLSRILLGQGDVYGRSTQSMEILLIMAGEAAIEGDRGRLPLKRGESAVVCGRSTYQIRALSERATLFRVSLP